MFPILIHERLIFVNHSVQRCLVNFHQELCNHSWMNFIVSHDSFREIWVFLWASIFGTIKFDRKLKLLIYELLQFGMLEFELLFSFLCLLFDLFLSEHVVQLLFDISWWNSGFLQLTESIKSQIVQWFHQHFDDFYFGL